MNCLVGAPTPVTSSLPGASARLLSSPRLKTQAGPDKAVGTTPRW